MITQDVTYRIRVRSFHSDNEDHFVNMNEFSNGSEEVRKQWVEKITDHIWGSQGNSSLGSIRPWDFILDPDGSVESLPVSPIEGKSSGMYPAHYRIPPTSIDVLERQEQTDRQERFAFATLLYEIGSGKKPFEGLSSEEVQQRYGNAEFPDDVRILSPPLFIAILSLWSVEFANISGLYPFINLQHFLTAVVNPPRSFFRRITTGASSYIKAHPYLFAAQLTGVLLSTAAVVTLPIVGAVGFGALGPVGGSAAAAWQASLGFVEAGSLFAWCQSAAMGGTAVNAIIATGAAGGGVAAFATAAAAGQSETLNVDGLMKTFREVYRRGNYKDVGGHSSAE